MYFESLTRRAGIGANSYLLDLDGFRIVLDAGMDPKHESTEAIPRYDSLEFDSIDAIIVTHSHLDHVGTLPILMRGQPSAPVYMTEATGSLVEAMLHNSVNVMSSKRDELDLVDYPLFTHKEVEKLPFAWRFQKIGKPFHITSQHGSPECEFFDAGHILGSVGVMFYHQGRRIFYTGDVNFEDQTITKGAAFPEEEIDALIVETTRGASPRDEDYSREKEGARLAQCVRETLDRGGSVLIPVFAMGKTQEMLVLLNTLREAGEIPYCPVFIGGLSTKMTIIFDNFAGKVRRNFKGFQILKEMDLEFSRNRRKRRAINYEPGCIFALSSGMMSEKTVSNQFATQFLDNPKNSLLLVGYAADDTPAARILNAERGDKIMLDANLAPISLLCDVHRFDFSGHAPRDHILEFIEKMRPKELLLVHGDEDAMAWFADRSKELLPHTSVYIPESGTQVPLNGPVSGDQ